MPIAKDDFLKSCITLFETHGTVVLATHTCRDNAVKAHMESGNGGGGCRLH